MVAGIFAGDPETMSLKSCFPRIRQLEKEYGGLLKAMVMLSKKKKAERRTGQALAARQRGPDVRGLRAAAVPAAVRPRVAAGERLYVVRVEPETSRVVLGKLRELETSEMVVSNPNFIAIDELRGSKNVTVKIRYRSPFVPAVIEPLGSDQVRVVFDKPVPGVCPGQAAVFYNGDVVVGGGIIEK